MKVINPFDSFMILLALTPLGMLALHAAVGRIGSSCPDTASVDGRYMLASAFSMATGLWCYLSGFQG